MIDRNNSFYNWIKKYKYSLLWFPLALCLTYIDREFHLFLDPLHDNQIWEIFFNVFGMLYAVIAGLILVEEFKRFGDLHEDVELELNAMQDIRDYLIYMDEDDINADCAIKQKLAKHEIRKALFLYTASIINQDWEGMSIRCKKLDTDTTEELKSLISAVHLLRVNNKSDLVGLEQIMLLVSEITTLRTQRIALAHKRVPVGLNYLISFMGFVLVAGVISLNVASLGLHLVLTGISSSVILIIYFLFQDLSDPFSGQWAMSKDGFIKFMGKIYARLIEDSFFEAEDQFSKWTENKSHVNIPDKIINKIKECKIKNL